MQRMPHLLSRSLIWYAGNARDTHASPPRPLRLCLTWQACSVTKIPVVLQGSFLVDHLHVRHQPPQCWVWGAGITL